jgi:hypothetical protein
MKRHDAISPVFVLFVLCASAVSSLSDASASGPLSSIHARRAQELTIGLDFAEAHKELAAGDADDLPILIESGRLALYEADCDEALVTLARTEVAKTEEGSMLGDIARGCVRVTAATVVEKDAANAVDVRYQDEADRALTPLIVETVVKARDALTRDLGVTWPRPTRITVVRDLKSLSAMTGLPERAAQTTGTVAVAKWGRVTLLSPRAAHHGYPWRDTIAHELTHLAVTRATIDHAPLWLQEGVAKREEQRWRAPGPFDDRPPVDSIVARGLELKLDLPLDKLGPSIAMLPSADAAMVAFAEVTSFVRYYADTAGEGALPKLFARLRDNKSAEDALREASGADLKGWDTRWRANITGKPHDPLPAFFGLGTEPPDMRGIRENVRLAELLYGRNHPNEALVELDHVKTGASAAAALEDPSVRHLRARLLEASGKGPDDKEAQALTGDPKEVGSSYGPWWAIRGRFARARGDGTTADASFVEAVADDPLEVECACEGLLPSSKPASAGGAPLCDAAQARGEPVIGQE